MKPFLKWVGGKASLINDIAPHFPKNNNFTYVEPFVGGGAILFWVLENYSTNCIINDINPRLINCYKSIKETPILLLEELEKLQEIYNLSLTKETLYYEKRKEFNESPIDVKQAAIFIFLNKTGFNGLYRVNKKGEFNVPYAFPKSGFNFDKNNLINLSNALQRVEINCGNYNNLIIPDNSFIYVDPPYKPITKTSSFKEYSNQPFGDIEQILLKEWLDKNSDKSWLLSNSDTMLSNPPNPFFDELYNNYNIKRILAKRSINSKGDKRGKINELLIYNKTI